MYFCPNCNNIFDITKNTVEEDGEKQVGGNKQIDYIEIINKIIKDEDITANDVKNILLDDLVKDPAYKKLSGVQKTVVYNTVQQLIPNEIKKAVLEEKQDNTNSDNKAYFICKNCGYLKPIGEDTLIFSRVSSDISQSYTVTDVSEMANSDILPRTRKYVCSNSKCISHTDPSKREAVFFRINNSYVVKYVCLACN